MIKRCLVIIYFFSSLTYGKGQDCEKKLDRQRSYISLYQDQEKLEAMKLACQKQMENIEQCKELLNDSILLDFQLNSQFFLLEYFEKKADQKGFNDLIAEIEGEIKSQRTPIAAWALYALFHYQIKTEKNFDKGLEYAKRVEKFVEVNFENEHKEIKLSFLSLLKAAFYKKSNNISLAKASLWSAYAHAKKAEKIFDSIYHKSWGYRIGVLGELLSLPGAEKDINLTNECIGELVEPKSDYYNKSRNHKIILSLFNHKQLSLSHLRVILKALVKNQEYAKNLDINLQAARYFAANNSINEAIKYYFEAKRIPRKSSLQSSELSLIKAKIDFEHRNWKAMERSLADWKFSITLESDFDKIWNRSQDRIKVFQQVSDACKLYFSAFANSKNNNFLQEAVQLHDMAINGIQVLKNEISTDEDRIRLLADMIIFSEQALNAYHHYVEIMGNLRPEQYDHILNYFELNKSFNLLVNRSLNTDKFSLEELSLKASYEQTIASIEHQIGNELEKNDDLNLQLDDYRSKLTDLINSKQLRIDKIKLNEIQTSLTSDQSLMEFFSGNRNLFCLLINQNNVTFAKLGSDTIKGLNGNIVLYQHLNKDLAEDFATENLVQYKQHSYELYKLLIEPFHDRLQKRIILIADGILATLSWPALTQSNSQTNNPAHWHYLIYDYNFNSQPSAALWLKLRNYQANLSKFNFLSFAPEFANLKYNKEEANELARFFSSSRGFIKSKASLANFIEFAPKAKIIHIASHASSGTDIDNDLPRILMSDDTIYGKDIESIKFNSELAFLSACETGLGKVIQAEGVMSLARSFFGAGVKSVISTLWKVNDKITKEQVLSIYKNLIEGFSKSDAIRNMQLDYLNKVQRGQHALPYFWASYQCQGNTNPIFNPTSNYLLKVLSILPILSFSFIGLSFYFLRKSMDRFHS